MKTIRSRFALGCISLVLLIAAPAAFGQPQVGKTAPTLAVKELDGHAFDLSTLRGKVVLVNFWASWCPPCREEIPALDAFYRRYHARGLALIGLSADSAHDRADVVKVAHTIAYPVAMLADGGTNGFGAPQTLPITYVIDPAGIIRAVLTPDRTPVTAESLGAAVLPLLPNVR